MEATDRSKRVLAALVRQYIASGEPVASSLLVTAAGLGISSATVRHTLALLEEEGYVSQPHTSAGRVPTDRGYRFYVDLLLEQKRTKRRANVVEARLRRDNSSWLLDSLLPQVSHVLSQASRGVGLCRPAGARGRRVRSRGVRAPQRVTRSGGDHRARRPRHAEGDRDERAAAGRRPRQAANYLNAEFSGLPLHRAREAVLERIREERLLYDALMARAMRLASSTFTDLPDDRAIYVEGAASLLDAAQLTVGTLQALVQMIEEKQRLVRLLNEYIDGPGLTVVIGVEHVDPNLRPFSLIVSTYDDGAGTGTVGVIGPTRMRYSRAISVVDGAAQAVSRVLRDQN